MIFKENRKNKRIDSINLTYFALDQNGNIIQDGIGRTLNVSAAGILLETSVLLDLTQRVLLAIGLEDDLIDVKGNVVYSYKHDNGTYKTGIEFYDVDETAFQVLKFFINYFKKQGEKDKN